MNPFTAGPTCPTPSTPIEITSVGDKTENLTNYILNVTATGDGTTSKLITSPVLNVNWKENTQYNFSFDCSAGNITQSEQGNTIFFGLKYTDGSTAFPGLEISSYQQNRVSITTTANKTVQELTAIYKASRWNSGTITFSNLSIVEGTTAPSSYIPHGYKVPVIVGSNCGVVDLGTLNYTMSTNSNNIAYFQSQGIAPTVYQDFNNNKYYLDGYSFVRFGYSTATGYAKILSTTSDGKTLVIVPDKYYADATEFKNAMSGKYLYYRRATDDTWTAPTTTNIYLTKPLPKLGNKQDSINYKNQTLTMGTSYYEFTGNETFTSTYSTQFGYVFTCANILSGVQTSATSTDMLCTHFKNSGASTDIKFSFTSGTNLNFAVQTTWTSTSDFKAWLTAQKTAGTPVTVYYPLQDDVTISVTTPTGGVALPAISMNKGTNTLTASTSVIPNNIEAQAWCSQ